MWLLARRGGDRISLNDLARSQPAVLGEVLGELEEAWERRD